MSKDFGFVNNWSLPRPNAFVQQNRSITAVSFKVHPTRKSITLFPHGFCCIDHPEAWICLDKRVLFLCHNYEKATQPDERYGLIEWFWTYLPGVNSYIRQFENRLVFKNWLKSI